MPSLATGLGIDLELTLDGRLTAMGAVLGDQRFGRNVRGAPDEALRAVDAFAERAEFVFGHNVLLHDLPWLRQHAPHLALHGLPHVDTLLLSVIAFTEHPYHALLKDYKLVRDARNDPTTDARLSHRLLSDARDRLRALAQTNALQVAVVHALARRGLRAISPQAAAGVALVFGDIAQPSNALDADLRSLLRERVCALALAQLPPVDTLPTDRQLALLLAVAWLRVAGTPEATSPSILLPWVRRTFPLVTTLLDDFRERPCRRDDCGWCRRAHDPRAYLKRWFGFPDFRPDQRGAVAAGFAHQPLLALLPTGGGKSICFQLPALARYQRNSRLTIVVSPLQSLMHDQVDNFVALTGRLTPPERRKTRDDVRSGQAGILYVSPEQLRNPTFARAIASRDIGGWVFDEAHCLSKWGHDFPGRSPDVIRITPTSSGLSTGSRAEMRCGSSIANDDCCSPTRQAHRLGRSPMRHRRDGCPDSRAFAVSALPRSSSDGATTKALATATGCAATPGR